MATRPKVKVLPRETLDQIDDAIRKAADLAPVVEKAELCGHDCAHRKQVLVEAMEYLQNVKKHFGAE